MSSCIEVRYQLLIGVIIGWALATLSIAIYEWSRH